MNASVFAPSFSIIVWLRGGWLHLVSLVGMLFRALGVFGFLVTEIWTSTDANNGRVK